jgi:succinate dehydrogenase/fumarate reductase flavoprotein subunit
MLLRGALDRGIDIVLATRVVELVLDAGRVGGVRTERASGGAGEVLHATGGVVLACGGYEWDRQLLRDSVGYDVEPLTPPNNVGDGLRLALAAGAELANMRGYWGQPAMIDPTLPEAERRQFEWARGAPSSLVVDRSGARIGNEAAPYHDFSRIIGAAARGAGTAPAWMIFDHRVKSSRQILSMSPDSPAPAWLAAAPTLGELAEGIGVPPAALTATVERFNQHAAHGSDPDFGRTERGMTGPGRVRPLVESPFYALPLFPGTIGTNGGPSTDSWGRVRRAGGGFVDGLYAVGNAAACPLGDVYPGAGATLGPAVVFAFRAGRHVATS